MMTPTSTPTRGVRRVPRGRGAPAAARHAPGRVRRVGLLAGVRHTPGRVKCHGSRVHRTISLCEGVSCGDLGASAQGHRAHLLVLAGALGQREQRAHRRAGRGGWQRWRAAQSNTEQQEPPAVTAS
eukprot:scaffold96213_cov36-Phaeocystis_antarctica.AAC.2